ncbi:response regulator transcription factor [Micromonospora eburnea]|uniref:DNA-binding response regulator, NarL/FixJ family, contains REC and HTH domains n=1 Tax=Micromonospora eburnea TaxID=227316 RepID=A0A1C6UX70_9ACTN|nr:response regulator transcription factor [Micromonospora eburnea]SCL58611.1 DNA-binding response regulator, NarL/FixJ family, contains REC and HTH domains [Micromonospora eburnea]
MTQQPNDVNAVTDVSAVAFQWPPRPATRSVDRQLRQRVESEVGNRDQEPAHPHGQRKRRPPTARTTVSLHATDPIIRAGVIGQLRPRPEVLLLDEAEADRAEVAVVIVDDIDESALRTLRTLQATRGQCGITTVLVASHLDDSALVAAAEHGVAGIVRRSDASPDRLVTVIRSAAAGDGNIPPDLLGRLLKQVGTLKRDVLSPRGLTFTGLKDREIEVLRLLADGYNTSEIAAKLSYSERMIKSHIYDVTSRFHLRNRCHAVAFALRNGLI